MTILLEINGIAYVWNNLKWCENKNKFEGREIAPVELNRQDAKAPTGTWRQHWLLTAQKNYVAAC